MKIEVEVSAQRIADMFVGAIENNPMTRSWCSGINLRIDPRPLDERQSPWYSAPSLYEAPGFRIAVTEIENEHSGGELTHVITREHVESGLKAMAEKYPSHFGDVLAENDDNVTQDVFLQCVVLGKVIYG